MTDVDQPEDEQRTPETDAPAEEPVAAEESPAAEAASDAPAPAPEAPEAEAPAAAPEAEAPVAPEAEQPPAAAEPQAAAEADEELIEETPRVKPEIPGADLVPDIVPEGGDALSETSPYDEDGEPSAQSSDGDD